MRDDRKQGISYGYVGVPKGGLNINGVDFPAGPRPAGKSGWFKQLLMAGCEEISQAEYEASLGRLAAHGINLSPHVVIGLHYGHIRGEREALQRISRFPISSLVLVGLLPLYDTPMEGLSPPSPEEMAQFFLESRALFPRTPILLGCERPGGEHKQQTDLFALLAGINGVAYPAEGTVRAARSLGLDPIFSPWCCSLLFGLPELKSSGVKA